VADKTKYGFSAALALIVLALPDHAQAREDFPGLVHASLKMKCTPGCGLCHVDPNGGGPRNPWGTARGAFATIQDGGAILAKQMPPDFDRDGTDDVTELKAGSNPGIPGESSVCLPEYGCGARLARAPGPPGSFLWALAAGALLSLRRRQRRAG
jgi:MYXO-CTERM domain-containing protein